MSGKHSVSVRGLDAAGKDANLQGARFGRMFKDLPAAKYGDTPNEEIANLDKLAEIMISSFDAPKDGPDDEESGIPALYTYFGQFIDHDLTFDPNSSFEKLDDPSARVDFRTPAFDLDNIYGRGPGDQPYMYDGGDIPSFLLGDPLTMGSKGARDLQRNIAGRALIGDPRNDENAIVSQLQGLFLRFHNKMVRDNSKATFEQIQALVRHHYQYVVVNDFLARIVNASVLDELKTNGKYDKAKLKFFKGFPVVAGIPTPYMPIEFSVAAYRLGHSMVRPGYRLNDTVLVPIFPVPQKALPEGLTGFRRMISDWGIDWARFIDIDTRDYGVTPPDPGQPRLTDKQELTNIRRLQFAYKIDTALVDPLGSLPQSVAGNPPRSLAARNLHRGLQFGLPSGQVVAKAMGVPALPDAKILIGQDVAGAAQKPIADLSPVFAGNCPLWTYILAEAMQNHATPDPTIPVTPNGKMVSTPQLGPVGGRIVAEVFLGLMFEDDSSYLKSDPNWTPKSGAGYRLKDLVADALSFVPT
jgi:hypothetical protein